jgi:acetyltransferase-like isoleucine patch superfamily enzyme
MPPPDPPGARVVRAIHGVRAIEPDPDFEIGLAEHLRAKYGRDALVELYARFATGDAGIDPLMRRVLWRAAARRLGHGLQVGAGVGFKHLETFEVGDGVFIGAQAYIQGRFDGRCVIGSRVWIGPQCYLDARDLVIGDDVGLGPGVKMLGSAHSGVPADVPIIRTDLKILPVRIEDWADIGMNAVVMPGVTVGRGAIVGAGSVVTRDVPPFAVVAGVPARFLHRREGAADDGDRERRAGAHPDTAIHERAE